MNLNETDLRYALISIIKAIQAHDALEYTHQKEIVSWLESGAPYIREGKFSDPLKHLVVYFLLLDPKTNKILLVHHKKAALWIPAGGHLEEGEHPIDTVKREVQEELGIAASFYEESPFFLTSNFTQTPPHYDISLWYLLMGSENQRLIYDKREFHEISWFAYNEIPYKIAEPHMERFIRKFSSNKKALN